MAKTLEFVPTKQPISAASVVAHIYPHDLLALIQSDLIGLDDGDFRGVVIATINRLYSMQLLSFEGDRLVAHILSEDQR